MTYLLFSPASAETSAIAAGKIPVSISAYQKDLQTGVVEVDFHNHAGNHLLFARGQLVNIYRHVDGTERVDPVAWFQSLNTSHRRASLRALALTPQAVRLVKILLEQAAAPEAPLSEGVSLENQFESWMKHPVPALAHVRWPHAEALALLPGENTPPYYTLFVSSDQILHSAGGMMALYGWKEPCLSVSLLSSDARTPAWEEYLLHYSFSWMTTHLLERLVDLTGPTLINTIIREINFAAAAYGWNINLTGTGVTDQTIFSSPTEAAEVYSRLFEILFRHVETMVGADLLALLMRESALRLSKPCRLVMQEYMLITPV
jgi:hypothetical protein